MRPITPKEVLKLVECGGLVSNEEIAEALGWSQRKVTGLGLNGRTPGRYMWVAPDAPWPVKTKLPNFLGPRRVRQTISELICVVDPLPTNSRGEG